MAKKQQRRQLDIRIRRHIEDGINAPMVEIFGCAFALLLILFLMINHIVSHEILAMLDDSKEEANYRVSWENGSEGLVVLSFPDRLKILQTGESIPVANVCQRDSPFLRYASELYRGPTRRQLIFALVEGGTQTMARARDCLLHHLGRRPISIGWIIANQDLLKTVGLEEIPAEIKRAIRQQGKP